LSDIIALERLPVAASVAASPLVFIGGYLTVTSQDLFARKAFPVQPSAMMVNTGDPDNVTVIIPEDLPPVLLRVKVCEGVCPTETDPKSYPAADQVSDAGLFAA
jgi:hypothetical protein